MCVSNFLSNHLGFTRPLDITTEYVEIETPVYQEALSETNTSSSLLSRLTEEARHKPGKSYCKEITYTISPDLKALSYKYTFAFPLIQSIPITPQTTFNDVLPSITPPSPRLQNELSGRVITKHATISTAYSLRGGKLYAPLPSCGDRGAEWIKALALTIFYPMTTFVVKFAMPIVYLALKAIHWLATLFTCMKENTASQKINTWMLSLDEEFHCKRYLQKLTPLRAIISLLVQPIISLLALIPFTTPYFNKINGDMERWVNGFTKQDVETTSTQHRYVAAFTAAPCQQPIGALTKSTEEKAIPYNQGELITPEMQAILFRNAVNNDPTGASSKPAQVESKIPLAPAVS